jgi:hypothetical protein
MPPGVVASRFSLPRYRMRLFVARLSIGRPRTLELVNLALAVIGAWSVIYQVVRLILPDRTTGLGFALAGTAAGIVVAALTWLRITRRPQDLFRSAAASEDRAETLRRLMVEGMTHDIAYANLARLYAPIAQRAKQLLPTMQVSLPTDAAGNPCLVVAIAPPGPQRLESIIADIEEARSADWAARVSRFAAERQAYMATLRRSVSLSNKFGDEAGANIVLTKIQAEPDLAMSVNTATYGQIMRTSDSLVNEFALFASHAHRSAFKRKPKPLAFREKDLLKVLPWRRQVHSWESADDLLIAPRHRAAGVGVSLSLIDGQDKRTSVFVARRSSNVGTYPDVMHVVPSGMMNVHGDLRHDRDDLAALPRLAMMSEFLEECLDIAEFSGHSAFDFAQRVAGKLDELQLNDLNPEFTGLAVDLLNLRTDVCGVLDLTGRRPLLNAFNLSWEYTHTERLRRIDISSTPLALRRTDFVQSGIGSIHLAALWLAMRRASAAGSK